MNFRIPFPKLSPLQARFAASFMATAVLIAVWFISTLPSTAYSQSLPRGVQQPIARQGAHDVFFDFFNDDGDDEEGRRVGEEIEDRVGYPPNEFLEPLKMPSSYFSPHGGFGQIFEPLGTSPLDIDGDHEPMAALLSKRQNGFVNEMVLEKRSSLNIKFGEIQTWGLSVEQLFAATSTTTGATETATTSAGSLESGSPRTLYITFNACFQPQGVNGTTGPPPQLEMYVSNTTTNMNPGPNVQGQPQQYIPADEGFANATLFEVTGATYISIVAPNVTDPKAGNWTGVYNYELVASVKQPFHGVGKEPNLYLIDSDNTDALLITGNMTGIPKDTNLTTVVPPYVIFANPHNITNTHGLRKSYCGLKASVVLADQKVDVQVSITRRGLGHLPKEQFYLQNLNSSTLYDVWLAKGINGSEFGGVVYPGVNLTTKSDGNCRVIYDLDFCSEVAYAVPSNQTSFPNSKRLAQFYDSVAKSWYQNFTFSLDQIQCNTTQERTYSLVRSCKDCAEAYKTWLCAVTIPRCADFSSNATFLAPRGVMPNTTTASRASGPSKIFLENGTVVDMPGAKEEALSSPNNKIRSASRNYLIDQVIAPGRYKEIKPCQDLCYNLAQSCPATLGFTCPSGSQLEQSYGQRSGDGDITCSWLGAAYYLNSGSMRMPWILSREVLWIVCVGVIIEMFL